MIRLSSLSPNPQHEVMHSPWPDSFQSFQYPEKPFRASPVEGHRYPHHRTITEHSETSLLEHLFNIRNLVVVLFRGSYTEKQKKASKKIISLEGNEGFATRLQRTEHSLQSFNWLLDEVEGSDAQNVVEVASET